MVESPETGRRRTLKPATVGGLILAAALVAAVAIFLVASLARTPGAPDVEIVTIRGERIATAGLRGRVAVVNFWATDCAICVEEMPEMARTFERFRGRGLEFIAVAMRHDPPNRVVDYAGRNRLPFKVALDVKGEIAAAFGSVRFTPTTVVIDKRGRIVARILGAPDFAKFNLLLEGKLAEPG